MSLPCITRGCDGRAEHRYCPRCRDELDSIYVSTPLFEHPLRDVLIGVAVAAGFVAIFVLLAML